jgi:hypothetical protein
MQLDSHVRQIHSHVSSWAIHNAFPNAHGACFVWQYCPMASFRKHQMDHHPFITQSNYQIAVGPLSLLLKRSRSHPAQAYAVCKMPCPDLRVHNLLAHENSGSSSSLGPGVCRRAECGRYSGNLAVHEILEHFIFICSANQNGIDTQQQDSSATASRTRPKHHVELLTRPSHGQDGNPPELVLEEPPSPPGQTKTSCQSCNSELMTQGNKNRHWQYHCELGPRLREPCPFSGSLLVPFAIPYHYKYHCRLGPRDQRVLEVEAPPQTGPEKVTPYLPHIYFHKRRAG